MFVETPFPFKLLGKLPRQGNLVVSPFSIFEALSMAYVGARGQTMDEMSEVIGFPKDQKFIHLEIVNVEEAMKKAGVQIANDAWFSNHLPIELLYRKFLEEVYHSPIQAADFRLMPDKARAEINRRIAAKTGGKIQNLLGPGSIKESTVFVLTNAVYFKDAWMDAFDPERTLNRPFQTPDLGPLPAPFMWKHAYFEYAENEVYQFLRMPYKGSLVFEVLLPRQPGWISGLVDMLEIEGLKRLPKPVLEDVIIYLPRFKIEFGSSLREALGKLGMKAAFSEGADFSGITSAPFIYLDDVIQKASCEVNEEGTVAAAASAVMSVQGCQGPVEPPRPKIFDANHPFVFMIRDRKGEILFLGRVENPLLP